MDSKKAQGISLNFIVIAIIAALVLIIIIAFTVGGLGSSLSEIFKAGETSTEDSDIDLAKASCENLCNNAKQVDAPADWAAESYCTKTFTFEGATTHCWEAPISQACSDSGQDVYDAEWACDETNCGDAGCSAISCSGCDEELEEGVCEAYGYTDCTTYNGTWTQ